MLRRAAYTPDVAGFPTLMFCHVSVTPYSAHVTRIYVYISLPPEFYHMLPPIRLFCRLVAAPCHAMLLYFITDYAATLIILLPRYC